MTIDIFGQHETALQLRAARHDVLATNIANADTPNYKARDIDFQAVLTSESANTVSLTKTAEQHLNKYGTTQDAAINDVSYRIPTQPSLDGNTVESDIEQAAFAENVIQYRASLMFINGKTQTLRMALTGER